MSAADFSDQYWGRQPFLSHSEGFTDLLDADAVDEILSVRGLRTPFIRMARNGQLVPPERYTRGQGIGARIADQVDSARVFELLAEGTTVVLQALHRVWPPIREFATELARELGHRVQVNAYITPPSAQGFASHYDTHDVFVLQVAGAKAWTIHEPVVEHPLPEQPWEHYRQLVAEQAAREPYLSDDLQPGDALYLPRGWLHSARANTDVSIHLTVGVHTFTGAEVLQTAVRQLLRNPSLRQNLPMGTGVDPDSAMTAVKEMLDEASGALAAQDPVFAANALAAEWRFDTAADPCRPLQQLEGVNTLTESSTVALRTGVFLEIVEDAAGGSGAAGPAECVTLRLADREIDFPLASEALLRDIVAGKPVSAAQVQEIDVEVAVSILRRLLKESVVVAV